MSAFIRAFLRSVGWMVRRGPRDPEVNVHCAPRSLKDLEAACFLFSFIRIPMDELIVWNPSHAEGADHSASAPW